MRHSLDFQAIVRDNENAVRSALDRADYVRAFLVVHILIESLLRVFLKETDDEVKFSTLINKYVQYLDQNQYPYNTFVKELREFNGRRNRIIHNLWKKGYSFTNRQAKNAASASVTMYGLFIEWLETFEPDIEQKGFFYY